MPPLKFLPAMRLPALLLMVFAVCLAGGCSHGEPFPVADYLKAPGDLQGNRYVLEGEVDAQLQGKEGVGRLIAVHPLKDKTRLAVFISDTLNANLLVAQRYRFTLLVRKGGLLYVTNLDKI
jgi:hypothetical protein